MTNLTLAVDDDLLRAARKVAVDRHTSVNQLVRGFLEDRVHQAGRRQQALERLRELTRSGVMEVGAKTWTRQDLYDR